MSSTGPATAGFAVWVAAFGFAALHAAQVAVPVFTPGGRGEGQALAVAIFDFPLSWTLGQFEWGRDILYGNRGAPGGKMYALIFGIGGTIFWAGLGAAFAYVIRRLVRRSGDAA
jgi:hypothetical protein